MKYTVEQHKEALKLFIPAKGHEVHEYYGASLIKLKKNNKYSIKLQHGWSETGKNTIMSEGVIVNDFEQAINLLTILEQFSKDGETKSADLDFLNKAESSIVENALSDSEKDVQNIISKNDIFTEEKEIPVDASNIFD